MSTPENHERQQIEDSFKAIQKMAREKHTEENPLWLNDDVVRVMMEAIKEAGIERMTRAYLFALTKTL